MADEKFPEVERGEPISADRANLEGRVLERVAQIQPGSGMDGRHGGSVLQFSRTLDAKLATLRVTDDSDAPVYLGVLRQYNFQSDEWSDGEKLWKIDAGATDSTFNEDDLVVAYYDRKRGAFIPVVATLGHRAVKLTENMGATTAKEAEAVFREFDLVTRTYSDTAETVTVYDPQDIFGHGLEFQYGLVWSHGGISELIVLTGEWRIASLTATLNEGSSAAADVVVAAGTASITVHDKFLAVGDSIVNGSDVGIDYDHAGGNWKATEAKC